MFGNVTALEGLHVIWEIQERKHDAHMRQACGLGSSHIVVDENNSPFLGLPAFIILVDESNSFRFWCVVSS